MPKRFALGFVLVIAILGAAFICLDICDIEEGFRLHWPIHVLNTAFIFLVAVIVAYVAARAYLITGSPALLWLGGGALAFGVGSLLRGWLPSESLNPPITAYDSAALIASALHLVGAAASLARLRLTSSEARHGPGNVLGGYLGILAGIALVTLLAIYGVIPPFFVPGENNTLIRVITQVITAIFFLASSSIHFVIYSRLRTDFSYWYALGLLLLAFGLVLISQGPVDSRIAWLGRASQYAGGIYFLVAIGGAHRRASSSKD